MPAGVGQARGRMGARVPDGSPRQPRPRHAERMRVVSRRVAAGVEPLNVGAPKLAGQRVQRPTVLAGGIDQVATRFKPGPRHQRV